MRSNTSARSSFRALWIVIRKTGRKIFRKRSKFAGISGASGSHNLTSAEPFRTFYVHVCPTSPNSPAFGDKAYCRHVNKDPLVKTSIPDEIFVRSHSDGILFPRHVEVPQQICELGRSQHLAGVRPLACVFNHNRDRNNSARSWAVTQVESSEAAAS